MAPEAALLPRLREVLYSGQISEGAPVTEFEQRFGAFVGQTQYAVLSIPEPRHCISRCCLRASDQARRSSPTAMTAEPTNLAILHAGGARGLGRCRSAQRQSFCRFDRRKDHAAHTRNHGGCTTAASRPRWLRSVPSPSATAGGNRGCGACAGRALCRIADRQPVGIHDVFAAGDQASHTVDGGMLACRDPADLPRGRRLRWFGIDRAAPRTEMDVARSATSTT